MQETSEHIINYCHFDYQKRKKKPPQKTESKDKIRKTSGLMGLPVIKIKPRTKGCGVVFYILHSVCWIEKKLAKVYF